MRNLILVILLFLGVSVNADSTGGYKKITNVYLVGTDFAHFYLENTDCPADKNYYTLRSSRVDVDRFYSLILGAFMGGKKVNVVYEKMATFCEVLSVSVEE